MSSRPAAERPSRNSRIERAPAMQPVNVPCAARSVGESPSSATMSLTPIRPPGRRTRAISAKTAPLSAARLMTQLLMTTSTSPSVDGQCLDGSLPELDVRDAGLPRVRLGEVEHLLGHVDADRAAAHRRLGARTAGRRSRRPSPDRGRSRLAGALPRLSDCRSRARPGGPRRAAHPDRRGRTGATRS